MNNSLFDKSNVYSISPTDSKPYLSNLTPLRGIAALLTILFHTEPFLGFLGGGVLLDKTHSAFISQLYLMVDFFFILSGFIICYVYAGYFTEGINKESFRKFFVARFARIYPLHIFSLLFTAGIWALAAALGFPKFPIMQVANSTYSFITNLFLLHSMNLHNWYTFTHASWSISTEWWMYMLFPFIVGGIFRMPKNGKWVLLLLCIAGYFFIEYVLSPMVEIPKEITGLDATVHPGLNVTFRFGFVRCLVGFIIGMITYLAYKEDWAKTIFGSSWVFLIAVLGLVLALHFDANDIVMVLFFPVILLSAAYGNASLNKILATKPLQRLGDWSYSIYLIHQPFLSFFTLLIMAVIQPKAGQLALHLNQGSSWLLMLGFIAFVLFAAYLSYRFIEVPMRKYINKKWG